MLNRLMASLIVAFSFAFVTIATWSFLRENDETKTALIAESESYAARSQLVRNIESLLDSLRDVRGFWSAYGHLPRAVWTDDAGIDLEYPDGIELLAWNDADRDVRYIRSAANPDLDYRPGDQEWQELHELLDRAAQVENEAILGPLAADDGGYRLQVVTADPDGPGIFIAVLDADRVLEYLLQDESPGYAISVFQGEAQLYHRGNAAHDIPPSWTRDGVIETSMGARWRVVHTPTPTLVNSLRTPAIDALLPLGLAISVLIGSLIFENGRAGSRAAAAHDAEQQLVHLNRNLERQIRERTEELANRNSDLETITDSVAHDLRNPLNAISVNTQVLQQQFGIQLGREGMEALERTASSVRRMTDILNRLVGLSIISHTTFHREPVDMAELVSSAFDELHLAEPSADVHFVMQPLPKVDADPRLVQTLISNLIGNALKYTRGRDKRQIEASFTTEKDVHTYCIRDNGIGFDEGHAERLFRAFERLPSGTKVEGLGLGLTIAARVVERHGGLIWAEGRPDSGAAFFFTLQPQP